MKEILQVISLRMKEAKVNFCIGRKKGKPQYPYFVGQLYLTTPPDESGKTEYELLIDGFDREDELRLLEATETIKAAFDSVNGYVAQTDNGVMTIFFDSMIPEIPTGEDTDLNRNESRLKIKYWKG